MAVTLRLPEMQALERPACPLRRKLALAFQPPEPFNLREILRGEFQGAAHTGREVGMHADEILFRTLLQSIGHDDTSQSAEPGWVASRPRMAVGRNIEKNSRHWPQHSARMPVKVNRRREFPSVFLFDIFAHDAHNMLMAARDVIKRLEAAVFVNKGGSRHDRLVHPDGRTTVVFRHKGDLPVGTLKAISRQTGIPMP